MDAKPSPMKQQANVPEERRAKEEAERQALWRMSPEERESAMWGGRLSSFQLLEWSRKRPGEVPRLGNEFAWIVMTTPEWGEAEGGQRRPEPAPASKTADDAVPRCPRTGKPLPDCSCSQCHELFVAALRLRDEDESDQAARA
jgi:hypothetical protein